jgi:ABC-type oligopeptide transport system substrate-binding subunit
MLKNVLIAGVIAVCMLLSGCENSVNYDIPGDAIAISDRNENTYLNPNDSEDAYSYVEIDGVMYLPYGTQGKTITSKEVGSCIAYSETDSNERFYEVNGTNDFIASYCVDGEMEQFDFWRSADTIGKEIDVPDFIDDLGYEIWN